MLCAAGELRRRRRTVSPSRTRSIGPGTVPPNVQKTYSTPFASMPFSSVVSRSTATTAAAFRDTGRGTIGGASRTALTSVVGLVTAFADARTSCADIIATTNPTTTTAVRTPYERFIAASPAPSKDAPSLHGARRLPGASVVAVRTYAGPAVLVRARHLCDSRGGFAPGAAAPRMTTRRVATDVYDERGFFDITARARLMPAPGRARCRSACLG